MKRIFLLLALAVGLLLTMPHLAAAWVALTPTPLNLAFAQERHQSGNHTWPDTLEIVTVTGTALVNTDAAHPFYYLDEDGDATADCHLSFGPWWYEPPSGAIRPEAGQSVTIVGALQESQPLATILVFEMDGLTWRVPVEYGLLGWNSEPFWSTQGEALTVTGVVLIDTTYFYEHYYLDTSGDSIPEYKLGLGPPWYEPTSGATRPVEGDTVTVSGLLHENDGLDLLAVYEIDGLEWRPFNEPAPWAGQWIHRVRQDTTWAYCGNCMNDGSNWIAFPPGHMGGGMGGMQWPDSIFVQFWEIHPDSLPGLRHAHRFMGFYLDVHDPMRNRLMNGQFGGHHGRMRFEGEHRVRFRYFEEDLVAQGLAEEDLQVQYWDEDQQQWVAIAEASVDIQSNSVTFSSDDLASYYALFAPNVATAVEEPIGAEQPSGFELDQNYPNPFNPTTVIPFKLAGSGHVVLEIYDIMGRRVTKLVDGVLQAGTYEAEWDGRNEVGVLVAGGPYIYRLQAGSFTEGKTMILVK